MALSLFGVVRSDHPRGWFAERAAGQAALQVVTAPDGDELAVVVAVVPPDHTPSEAEAVEFLEVVSRLVGDGPVVPFRFGTTAPDAEAVRSEVLVQRAAELSSMLDALDGLVEVQVELTFDVDAGLAEAAATDPALRLLATRSGAARTVPERMELGEQIAVAMTEWWHGRTEEQLAAATALAERTAAQAPEQHRHRRAFLVRRERLDELDQVLTAVIDTAPPGVHVETTGPLPAYSFLDDIDPAPPAGSRWGW